MKGLLSLILHFTYLADPFFHRTFSDSSDEEQRRQFHSNFTRKMCNLDVTFSHAGIK
jgi:hypothetical protein